MDLKFVWEKYQFHLTFILVDDKSRDDNSWIIKFEENNSEYTSVGQEL